MHHQPYIIAIEGCNGSGKSTSLSYIQEQLSKQGYTVDSFKAPDYSTFTGKQLLAFLKGQILSGDTIYEPKSNSELSKQDLA